ncbi:MAG TPA: NAD(P)H-binding protein [Vicinamibacterales bacterium]|nr:NAD(P)H-binding protein [Vicinamibacterales bacterium]
MNIAITGANSSVGNILLRHLAARADIRVVACVRSARAAASLLSSPRISTRAIDYDDGEGLAAALIGTACVVHLAGILFESSTSTYQTANVGATRAVVDACRKAGISRVVLVSVLGADAKSTNRFWSSKGRAECIVAESGLSAAIIRTPILLGPGMAGARAVVHAAAQPTVTLLGGGRHSIRPLDADDLSRAILRCCETSGAGAAVYELVGPEPTVYRDVIVRTAALMGREVAVRSMPVWLAKLGAAVAGWTRQGGMTPTVIDVITSDEAVHENADVALGVTLTPLSATLEKLLSSKNAVPHP